MQAAYNRGSFASNSSSGRQLLEVSTTFEHPPTHSNILHVIRESSRTFYNPPPNSTILHVIRESPRTFYNHPPSSTILHQILPPSTKFYHPPPNSATLHQILPSTTKFQTAVSQLHQVLHCLNILPYTLYFCFSIILCIWRLLRFSTIGILFSYPTWF